MGRELTGQRTQGTWLLIIVTATIFVIDIVTQRVLVEWGAKTAAIWYGEYWRLFTASFLHADLRHLLFNMYALFVFGRVVESILGTTRFYIAYLISGAFGYLLSLIVNPEALAVGASASLFGLIGYTLHYRLRRLPWQFMQIDRALLQIIGINLVIGFLVPNIDQAAHIGGLLGGILVAPIVGMPSLYRNEKRQTREIILALVLSALLAFSLLKPMVVADLVRPVAVPVAEWIDSRAGRYFTPLSLDGVSLFWHSSSLNQWSPAGNVVSALNSGWVDLAVFWRWGVGVKAVEATPYAVIWKAIKGRTEHILHIDQGVATHPDADPSLIYLKSTHRVTPGVYQVEVDVAGRIVVRQRITVR